MLLRRPGEVWISVRVEPVETLRQAQGERFVFHLAGSIEELAAAHHTSQRFRGQFPAQGMQRRCRQIIAQRKRFATRINHQFARRRQVFVEKLGSE